MRFVSTRCQGIFRTPRKTGPSVFPESVFVRRVLPVSMAIRKMRRPIAGFEAM
jgi:hypothetical protein